jgi:hypothetical protein
MHLSRKIAGFAKTVRPFRFQVYRCYSKQLLLDREASSFLGARWIQHVIHDVRGQTVLPSVECGTDWTLSRKGGIHKDSKCLSGFRCIGGISVEREARWGE